MNNNIIVNKRKAIIKCRGSQISVFSDEFVDYVCITDIYNAFNKNNESIISWLTSNQSLLFLDFWEKKHNPKYDETRFCNVKDLARI
jgi:hypothetical protein